MSTAPNVTIIPAKIQTAENRDKYHQLKVAAYCRVSTEQEEQQNSYQVQIAYYTDLINRKKEWTLAGIFADEGISGTQTKKRTEFNRMIRMCKNKKIDLVITKSISRFARNTVDCLEYVRQLKDLGIGVIFEKENINTLTMTSEFMIALYGSFAQAESESISKNVSWGKGKAYREGKVQFQYKYLLGYKKGADGKPEIVPEEAETVRLIYTLFLDGYSMSRIKKLLENKGILTSQGNKVWNESLIRSILKNEKYMGDALLQKTYTSETLPTTRHRNKGECEQYYAEGTHPPIITTETFERVQNLIQARKQNYGKTPPEMTHLLSRKVVCGCCGTMFRRKPQRGKYYWCCIKHDENREKCHITPITEQSIPILEQMLETLQTIRDRRLLWSEDIVSLNKKISELSSQNQTLAFLKQNGLVDPDIFISKSNELTRQLRQAKLDKEELMAAEGDATAQRTQELIALLEDGPDFLDHPDTELCGALVAEIIVESNDTLRFRLHNGLELRESIERTVR